MRLDFLLKNLALLFICFFSNSLLSNPTFKENFSESSIISPPQGEWTTKNSVNVYVVKVIGIGSSRNEALEKGLREAINQAVGALVITESEVKNLQLTKMDILQHSSGYIDSYRILNEIKDYDQFRLELEVYVRESRIADRVLNISSKEAKIDGQNAHIQQKSFENKIISAQEILKKIISDFPSKAFDISVGKSQWKIEGKNITIAIPFQVKWNLDYINALNEYLIATKDSDTPLNDKFRKSSTSVFALVVPGKWSKTYAAYNDKTMYDILYKAFITQKPKIMVVISNNIFEILYKSCLSVDELTGFYFNETNWSDRLKIGRVHPYAWGTLPGQFFAISPPDAHLGIYGDFSLASNIMLKSEGVINNLDKWENIVISVVKSDNCSNLLTKN